MKWNKITESQRSNADTLSLYKLMYDDVSKILTDVSNNPSKYGIDEVSEYFSQCIENLTKDFNDLRNGVERKGSDGMMDRIHNEMSMDIAMCMDYEISDAEANFLGELDSAINVDILKYKTTRSRLPKPSNNGGNKERSVDDITNALDKVSEMVEDFLKSPGSFKSYTGDLPRGFRRQDPKNVSDKTLDKISEALYSIGNLNRIFKYHLS